MSTKTETSRLPGMDERIIEYGRWSVIGTGPKKGSNKTYRCRCACGTERDVRVDVLESGGSVSCGCFAAEARSKRQTTHGEGRRQDRSKEYRAWQNMIARCENPANISYRNYGGKGVTVASEWRASYETFLNDMGRAPGKHHSVDRIDGAKGYGPTNCRWATGKQQGNNRIGNIRVTVGNETKTIAEWTDSLGLSRSVVYKRHKRGWLWAKLLSQARGYGGK